MNRKDLQNTPQGIVVAGLGGGSGKSVVAVGLVAALRAEGRHVVPFKKGPDYIDAGWLSLAAGMPCYNLDPFLMQEEAMLNSFQEHAAKAELIVIEGNRGLFDGFDAEGTFSTAELAKWLQLPVLLVVDCTKTTRTVAALVLGCKNMDPELVIAGVVLNRIGTTRHERIVREAVEKYTGIPVLGAIRRMKRDIFPMRHLGVTPFQEYDGAENALDTLIQTAKASLDLERILMSMTPSLGSEFTGRDSSLDQDTENKLRIGVIRDAAFQFYYPENLKSLEKAGGELVEINALTATEAKVLADNVSFKKSLKERAEKGLPIYAECGGLIYLGESIMLEGKEFPLVGVFPVKFTLEKRPQAHGYTVLTARDGNPFYRAGSRIKGHEFRYSKITDWEGKVEDLGFDMNRGVGFTENSDGLIYKNVLALYTHIHAVATPEWTEGIIRKAREFQQNKALLHQ
ncbi:MAG: cobyrinate a,c-diamide synthase [Deltaproteobacteria bacterium]|nr:cobyrinate a,c-diamide synthase [Deltaproteobacteria bacterium]